MCVAKVLVLCAYAAFFMLVSLSLVSIEDFVDLAVKRIASFVGIKYSDPDLAIFNSCRLHGNGDLHLMYGCDQVMELGTYSFFLALSFLSLLSHQAVALYGRNKASSSMHTKPLENFASPENHEIKKNCDQCCCPRADIVRA